MKKTIFITGSTDGIGKLTATKLAKQGHKIYLHGRNKQKLEATVSELKSLSKNDNISGYLADFSDLDSVRNMAIQINKDLTQIDVLINNAGVFTSSVSSNKNGLDIRFLVNYLAPYLLTNELIPLLAKSPAPRVINLSSAAQAAVSENALKGKETIPVQKAYSQSKLALTMWSFSMAEKYKSITIIAVNPGSLLNTKMVQEAYGQFWAPVDKGADILIDLATSEKFKNASGKYFDNDKGGFSQAHEDAYNAKKVAELIAVTNQIIGK